MTDFQFPLWDTQSKFNFTLFYFKTFNSLYGIQERFEEEYIPKFEDFQFPLWDTQRKQKLNQYAGIVFQFPLWDTSIPAMAGAPKWLVFQFPLWDTSKILNPQLMMKTAFNSLYGIRIRYIQV